MFFNEKRLYVVVKKKSICEKDTCKLAFDAIRWEVTAVAIDKNYVYNVISNVTLSFDLQKKKCDEGVFMRFNSITLSQWMKKV